MVSVTLRFNYPGFEDIEDDNEVRALLEEMPFDEILSNVIDAGKPINMDVEIY
jgi:hypothetical protein